MATFTKQIVKEGNGATPQKGQNVTVEANLYLSATNKGIWSTHAASGFDHSAKTGPQPFSYKAMTGGVIRGWDDGVATMKLGERARLTIPGQYAYGPSGHPGFGIPSNAELVFEIEVLRID